MYAINAQNNARSTECLTCALDAGELLLTYGAEVSRVEDTIQRLEHVCGFDLVDVFTITSSIVQPYACRTARASPKAAVSRHVSPIWAG